MPKGADLSKHRADFDRRWFETDGSGAACEREAGRDNRIRVYHTANRGAGPARNLGMDLARGDYFHFFDIDDYLVPNAISLLVKAAEETSADLVSGGFAVDDHNKNQRVIPKADHLYRTGEQVRNDFYPHMFMFGEQGIFQSACFKLFRAETVRKHGVPISPTFAATRTKSSLRNMPPS